MIDLAIFPRPGRALPFAPLMHTTEHNAIPAITHKLGSHWRQPEGMRDVLMNDAYVWMSGALVAALPEYSRSLPTGTYEGKCWVSQWRQCDDHDLVWYYDTPEFVAAGQIGIARRTVIFTDTKEQ